MKYNTTEKLKVYESAGVPEYWIVSEKKETITVYTLQSNEKYDEGRTYKSGEKVPVQTLKGLEIDLEELFAEFKDSHY